MQIGLRRFIGESAGGSSLLIDLGKNGIVCGGSRNKGRMYGSYCRTAGRKIPSGAGFNPIHRVAFVHDERIAGIDISTEAVLFELLGRTDRRRACRQGCRYDDSVPGCVCGARRKE
jgi:hypothetical protein